MSGNVRQKLREAQEAAAISPLFEPNVRALEKAQPKDLDASEIDVRLGATWVDRKYIQQFMEETFEIPFYQRRAVQVQYSNYTSEKRSRESPCSGSECCVVLLPDIDAADVLRADPVNLVFLNLYINIRRFCRLILQRRHLWPLPGSPGSPESP